MQLWRAIPFIVLIFDSGMTGAEPEKCYTVNFFDKQFKRYICYSRRFIHWSIMETKVSEYSIATDRCNFTVSLNNKDVKVGPLSINSKEEENFVFQQFSPEHKMFDIKGVLDNVLLVFRQGTIDFYDGTSNDYIRKQFGDDVERVKRNEFRVVMDLSGQRLKLVRPGDLWRMEWTGQHIVVLCKAVLDDKPPTTTQAPRTSSQMGYYKIVAKTTKPPVKAMADVASTNSTAKEAIQQSSPSVQLLAFTCGLAAFLLRSLCIRWT